MEGDLGSLEAIAAREKEIREKLLTQGISQDEMWDLVGELGKLDEERQFLTTKFYWHHDGEEKAIELAIGRRKEIELMIDEETA